MTDYLKDSLEQLKTQMQNFNSTITASEQAIDNTLGALLKSADDTQKGMITAHIAGVKKLLTKAKRGDDIEKDV